ncbi:MAG: DUF72 domain-containing protein [Chloroflexi bacterium]|nr:DUF72 domain-containing protein [Chloroflexota bacterium]
MAARILVGTCSWTDKTLIDSGWYPRDVRTPEDRLRHYAEQFPIVEVDSTYYGLPSERNAALWTERTPQQFVFNIKSYALFTHHPAAVRSLPKDLQEELPPPVREKANFYYRDLSGDLRDELWRRFASALLPLDSAGKLGAVLFQFPPWFLPNRESKECVLEAKSRLPQYTIAVEFRNDRWLAEGPNRERTLQFLADNELPFVCVDEPQGFRSSVPPVAEATAPLSIVRFHGRNSEMWQKRGVTSAERFDYLYSEEELAEWVPPLQRLAERAREVHVLMPARSKPRCCSHGRSPGDGAGRRRHHRGGVARVPRRVARAGLRHGPGRPRGRLPLDRRGHGRPRGDQRDMGLRHQAGPGRVPAGGRLPGSPHARRGDDHPRPSRRQGVAAVSLLRPSSRMLELGLRRGAGAAVRM